MYYATKEFQFDFGHRVQSQELNSKLSCAAENKCRKLHGHRGTVAFTFKSKNLNNNVVEDFNNLAFIKKWIDISLDHKTILYKYDPFMALGLIRPITNSDKGELLEYEAITSDALIKNDMTPIVVSKQEIADNKLDSFEKIASYIEKTYVENRAFFTITITKCKNALPHEDAWNTTYVMANFVPTAENISAAFYYWVKCALEYLKLDESFKLHKVDFYETPTAYATFKK